MICRLVRSGFFLLMLSVSARLLAGARSLGFPAELEGRGLRVLRQMRGLVSLTTRIGAW